MKSKALTVALAVLLLAGAVCGVYFTRQAADLRTSGESSVAAAETQLAEAQARYDAVNPDSEAGAAAWKAAEEAVFTETQEKIDALTAENTELDSTIESLESEAETKLADEDTAYYNSVYEEMVKGIEEVQGYIDNGLGGDEAETEEEAGSNE